MTQIIHRSGLKISLPQGVALEAEDRGSRSFDFSKPIDLGEGPEEVWDELSASLTGAEMKLVDSLILMPEDEQERGGAGFADPMDLGSPAVEVEVPLDSGEDAVVLVNQGGRLRWLIPPAKKRRSEEEPTRREVRRFIIAPEDAGQAPDDPGKRRGWLVDWVKNKIKAYVLCLHRRGAGGYPSSSALASPDPAHRTRCRRKHQN